MLSVDYKVEKHMTFIGTIILFQKDENTNDDDKEGMPDEGVLMRMIMFSILTVTMMSSIPHLIPIYM